MQNVHVKWNPGLPWQTQHQQTGLKLLWNHSAVRVTHIDLFATSCVVERSGIATFYYTTSYSQLFCVTCCVKVIRTESGCLGLKLQTRRPPDSTLTEPRDCNRETFDSDTPLFFLSSLSSVETMALRRSDERRRQFVFIFFWGLLIVKLKLWAVTLTATSPQLVHVQDFDLSLSFYLWKWQVQ